MARFTRAISEGVRRETHIRDQDAAPWRHLGDYPLQPPLNLVSHKLAPAIATNNRVVLKPAETTPLTALALAELLYEAGLPPEMLSVVTGRSAFAGRRDDQ
jgi:delta 1-pyrroline-5-carboxylate dehydrogenase